MHLYVRSQKFLDLGLERLCIGFGLGPEIKGLGLVTVSRKLRKVSVSVSFRT